MRKSIAFLRDYLGAMDIPSDEDGLIRFVLDTFTQSRSIIRSFLIKPILSSVTRKRKLSQKPATL